MTDINLINADVLTVGPDERLIIHIREDLSADAIAGIVNALKDLGIQDRALVLFGVEATFAKTADA